MGTGPPGTGSFHSPHRKRRHRPPYALCANLTVQHFTPSLCAETGCTSLLMAVLPLSPSLQETADFHLENIFLLLGPGPPSLALGEQEGFPPVMRAPCPASSELSVTPAGGGEGPEKTPKSPTLQLRAVE